MADIVAAMASGQKQSQDRFNSIISNQTAAMQLEMDKTTFPLMQRVRLGQLRLQAIQQENALAIEPLRHSTNVAALNVQKLEAASQLSDSQNEIALRQQKVQDLSRLDAAISATAGASNYDLAEQSADGSLTDLTGIAEAAETAWQAVAGGKIPPGMTVEQYEALETNAAVAKSNLFRERERLNENPTQMGAAVLAMKDDERVMAALANDPVRRATFERIEAEARSMPGNKKAFDARVATEQKRSLGNLLAVNTAEFNQAAEDAFPHIFERLESGEPIEPGLFQQFQEKLASTSFQDLQKSRGIDPNAKGDAPAKRYEKLLEGDKKVIRGITDTAGGLRVVREQFQAMKGGDPTIGRVRKVFKEYDGDASKLQAAITAIVPSLARGVFGEVGVLTDQDVVRYTNLIPNAKTPEDLGNALFDMLNGALTRKAQSELKIAAINGQNVEALTEMYLSAGVDLGEEFQPQTEQESAPQFVPDPTTPGVMRANPVFNAPASPTPATPAAQPQPRPSSMAQPQPQQPSFGVPAAPKPAPQTPPASPTASASPGVIRGRFDVEPADLTPHLGKGLQPHAQDFIDAGREFGLDPRFLAAISKLETANGTSSAFRNKNNAMGISNSRGPISLSSVRDSIFQQAKSLARSNGYYAGADTIDEIGAIYAPPGAGNDPNSTNGYWPTGVKKFYNEMTENA